MSSASTNSAAALNGDSWQNAANSSLSMLSSIWSGWETTGLETGPFGSGWHLLPIHLYPDTSAQPASAAGESTLAPTLVTSSTDAPPSDELFEQQWHFGVLGDIQKIWEEFTRSDVHVGIYDDGLETDHPDLDDNYDAEASHGMVRLPARSVARGRQ